MKYSTSIKLCMALIICSCTVSRAQTPAIANFQTSAMIVTGYTMAATANAASEFSLNISIDSAGSISGNGTVRSYSANSRVSSKSSFTILAGSKITAPIESTDPISESSDGSTSTSSDHSLDCIILTSNRVEIKGRLTYRYRKSQEGSDILDDSLLSFVGAGFYPSRPKEAGGFGGGAVPSNPL